MQKDPSIARQEALKEIRAAIDLILEKSDVELTQSDIGFLRARRSYLTSDQIHAYPSAFPEAVKKQVEKKPEQKLDPEAEVKAYVSRLQMSNKDLRKLAVELGMKDTTDVSREQLEEFVISERPELLKTE